MAFKQGRIFIVPHLAVALGLGLSSLVHRTAPHSVALYDPVRVLMAFGLILIRVITWQSGYSRNAIRVITWQSGYSRNVIRVITWQSGYL